VIEEGRTGDTIGARLATNSTAKNIHLNRIAVNVGITKKAQNATKNTGGSGGNKIQRRCVQGHKATASSIQNEN
jgi:hypothetical protein